MADDSYEVPITRDCFGCGTENAYGLGLKPMREGRFIRASYLAKPFHRGFSRTLHGGLVGALLDEVLAMAVATEVMALVVTVELTIKFKKPVPMDEEVKLEAWDAGPTGDGRRRKAEAKLTDGKGTLLASGSGIYQPIPPERFHDFVAE